MSPFSVLALILWMGWGLSSHAHKKTIWLLQGQLQEMRRRHRGWNMATWSDAHVWIELSVEWATGEVRVDQVPFQDIDYTKWMPPLMAWRGAAVADDTTTSPGQADPLLPGSIRNLKTSALWIGTILRRYQKNWAFVVRNKIKIQMRYNKCQLHYGNRIKIK